MVNSIQRNIIDLVKRSQRILILPSSPPDGDSIGSAIALYLVFKKLGKESTVICHDPVPEALSFLPHIKAITNKLASSKDFIITIDLRNGKVDKIKSDIEENKVNIVITPSEGRFTEQDVSFTKGDISYDLIITVDCAELGQLRKIYDENTEMFHRIPVVNIDHHVSNSHFGRINYVDIMSSSTTELLLPLLEELAKEEKKDLIDEDVATLLLTGIITDTGSFQNANTTPMAFEKASALIAYGARQQEIIQYIYKTKQLSQLKLWGRILTKIQTDNRHKIVWSVITQQDFRDTHSSEDQIGDIIDELMTNAPGAEIIILVKEKSDGTVGVSLRTTTPAVDASEIAKLFGGGGHTQAAGFQIKDMDLRETEYKTIEAAKKYQAKRLNIVDGKDSDEIMNVIRPAEPTPTESIPVPAQAPVPAPASVSAQPKKSKAPKFTPKDPFEEAKRAEKAAAEKAEQEQTPAYKFES